MNLVDYIKSYINPKKKATSTDPETIEDSDIDINTLKQEIYFKELAVYTAISYIANAISKCEIKTYVNHEEVKNKDYFVLNYSANINENSSQFWHKVIEKMFYSQYGEALVIENNGSLYCADSYAKEEYPMMGNRYVGITIGNLQLKRSYRANEVYIFKLENKKVKSLIDGLHQNYSELLNHAIKSYKKANATKYKLKLDGIEAGDEEFNEIFEEVIKEQLKTFIENDNVVYPEYEGYNLEDISPKNNSKDASDIIALKKDIFETVAQSIKIPNSLLLGNITNMKEVMNSFITNAIDPYAKMISKELSRKQGYENWKGGNYAKVDTSKVNHIDIIEVADKLDKLISSGTTCIDETRGLIDMQPMNTDFSKMHFITKNYDTVENRLKGEE
ncbi:MAG: phage portal protein [Clostridium sp.]